MLASIAKLGRRRTGFTLVELLVAAALSILIMAVMATAFQSGLQTLSTLKSLGDMAERLKTAETMLRSDLDAEHFAITDWGDDSPGIQHLSDLRYDTLPPSPSPKGGYFKIRQGNPSLPEGVDADGLISTSADGNRQHQLSFTIRRRPRSTEGFFSAHLAPLQTMATSPPDDFTAIMSQRITDVMPLDGNLYVTNWAQVDWFLDTNRMTVLNNVPTWPLIRRVRVLGLRKGGPTRIDASSKTVIEDVVSLMSATPPVPKPFQLNDPGTISNPSNRPPATSIPSSSTRYGDDIVITNVLSFEVRPMYTFMNPGVMPGAFDGVFADLPGGANANFDTAHGANLVANPNSRIRVQAVQIKIRVYDPKNKLTRQTTLVVKL